MLKEEITALEKYKIHAEVINNSVSQASVGWHIYHSLLVIKNILGAIKHSNPERYVASENKGRDYVLGKEFIKRGVARSPASVTPPEEINDAQIENLFMGALNSVSSIDQLPEEGYFEHHNLGQLKKQEALKFLSIHTRHHLKIIEDIMARK